MNNRNVKIGDKVKLLIDAEGSDNNGKDCIIKAGQIIEVTNIHRPTLSIIGTINNISVFTKK